MRNNNTTTFASTRMSQSSMIEPLWMSSLPSSTSWLTSLTSSHTIDRNTATIETNANRIITRRTHDSMFLTDNTCKSNCSGHGDCFNGTCFCEVEYSGGTCNDPNFKYYVSFSTVYYMICVVSFIQLMLCINSEIARQKPRNIWRAFRISTQKALYFFICLGTALRGYYFSSPANSHIGWAESLMSAYYPIVMSGCGLVVCFWAEVFHLDVSVERSRFLSKSFNGFIMFNVVTYSLLLAELVLFVFADPSDSDRGMFLRVFNSIYAIFMLIVVVFFLIYGVEVYFKLRGAFIESTETMDAIDGGERVRTTAATATIVVGTGLSTDLNDHGIADMSQLQQSRLGLISQAVLLLITILFMISEVFGWLWKDKVPVLSRNYHQVMFRVVEFGVALWFPCVLWNCIEPEKLWILNPRKILKKQSNAAAVFRLDGALDSDDYGDRRRFSRRFASNSAKLMLHQSQQQNGKTILRESERLVGGKSDPRIHNNNTNLEAQAIGAPNSSAECWICYESAESKPEAGPLIEPCECRGDVSAVHHQCLIRWLMEAYVSPDADVQCKVCNTPYRVEHSSELICLPTGLSVTHWLKSAAIVLIMCVSFAGSCMLVKMFSHMYVKTISVGCCILVEYICLRLLGFNLIAAYHRAKFSAIKIIGRKITAVSSANHDSDHPYLHRPHQQQQQPQQEQAQETLCDSDRVLTTFPLSPQPGTSQTINVSKIKNEKKQQSSSSSRTNKQQQQQLFPQPQRQLMKKHAKAEIHYHYPAGYVTSEDDDGDDNNQKKSENSRHVDMARRQERFEIDFAPISLNSLSATVSTDSSQHHLCSSILCENDRQIYVESPASEKETAAEA